jgi:prepilin-type N-terminal cleavage/methylation domain-containing protein
MRRPGFSLVELVVALTLFSVGVLGLAAAAATTQRAFAAAESMERAARAAAAVLDSLVRTAQLDGAGERSAYGTHVRWNVATDSLFARIHVQAEVLHASRTDVLDFEAARLRPH